MKIRTITLNSYRCFENTMINCMKDDGTTYQWTVFLGNNNTGKTGLLKGIAGLRPASLESMIDQNLIEKSFYENRYTPSGFLLTTSKLEDRTFGNKENLGIECTTTLESLKRWGYSSGHATIEENAEMKNFSIYGYGVSRYPSSTSLSESRCGDCDTLYYSDRRLINLEEWLMQLDYAAKSNNIKAKEKLGKIRSIICGNLFPEIFDFKFESNDSTHNYILFKTLDGWYRYTDLGYGYQSMLSWVVDLCKRFFDKYPDSLNPLEENAIVLVDEIDLHLHPEWQRNIISFLSNAFPNTQFIVTTHSPLVVQSMNEVNLYVLSREDSKVKMTHSEVTNFNGWTIEEILRDTMNMEEKIHTKEYQSYMNLFDEGLDECDMNKLKESYETLCRILHPENPVRRLLEMQYRQQYHD